MQHIVLHFKLCTVQNRLIRLLYSNSLWFLRINTVSVCVYACVLVSVCVRSGVRTVSERSKMCSGAVVLSFIDSQYVLLPGW